MRYQILFLIVWLGIAPTHTAEANDMAKVVKRAGELNIRRLKYFEGGVYGKLEESVYYITTREKAPNLDRLYLLMMKMLSKTYGCFLAKRVKSDGDYHFFCRDSRLVTMTPVFGDKLVLFKAVQRDRFGKILYVTDRQIMDLAH